MVVARNEGWWKWGDVDQMIQAFTYNQFWGSKVQIVNIVNNRVVHTQKLTTELNFYDTNEKVTV